LRLILFPQLFQKKVKAVGLGAKNLVLMAIIQKKSKPLQAFHQISVLDPAFGEMGLIACDELAWKLEHCHSFT